MHPSLEQIHELFAQMKTGRVSKELMTRFLENPDRYRNELGRFGRLWPAAVNYDLGLKGLIKAVKLDPACVNSDITSVHFPLTRKGIRNVELELYEFDEMVTGEDAARKIEKDGYVNEDIAALLTFGADHPVEQRRRPIVALGSRWQHDVGDVGVLYLGESSDERELNLCWFGEEFGPDFRVLVSRKK